MTLSEPCRCPGCRPSLRPDSATATPAELSTHGEHLRRLAAIGALPDPTFHPYPGPAPAATFTHEEAPF